MLSSPRDMISCPLAQALEQEEEKEPVIEEDGEEFVEGDEDEDADEDEEEEVRSSTLCYTPCASAARNVKLWCSFWPA